MGLNGDSHLSRGGGSGSGGGGGGCCQEMAEAVNKAAADCVNHRVTCHQCVNKPHLSRSSGHVIGKLEQF